MPESVVDPACGPEAEAPERLPGWRLADLEVLNWGTFHSAVWGLSTHGRNALITGDIGSGKSTLVDALTTLLVPSRRIVFNRAAGAEAKERSLGSYVRGAYRSERSEAGGRARAVALRGDNDYSVLLARFRNEGNNEVVSAAMVLWTEPGESNPKRLHLVADQSLSIAADFAGASGIQALRKALRARKGVVISDAFNDYQAQLMRRIGIPDAQALDLFYQTVAMKSVGNLTEFVRNNILEPPEVEAHVQRLCTGFDELSAAHQSIERARRQIELLTPLVAEGERFDAAKEVLAADRRSRDGIEYWQAALRRDLLQRLIERNQQQQAESTRRHERLRYRLEQLEVDTRALQIAVDQAGGSRLAEIARDLTLLAEERRRRLERDQEYKSLARSLGLSTHADPGHFAENRVQAGAIINDCEQLNQVLDERRMQALERRNRLDAECRELQEEIEQLKARPSNIPLEKRRLRAALAEALSLDESRLPFVGELIQVDERELDWEAAIERVLHGLALSLLVDEQDYSRFTDHVERLHLRDRLVYLRVRKTDVRPSIAAQPGSLPDKVQVRREHAYRIWVESQLARDFDYACVADMDTFRQHTRAVTRAGQVKHNERRHEKDDRFDLNDRRRFVLGWSTEKKRLVLEKTLVERQREGAAVLQQLSDLKSALDACRSRRDQARDLLQNVREFEEIDWKASQERIRRLEEERAQIEQGSDQLLALRQQLEERRSVMSQLRGDEDQVRQELANQRAAATQFEEQLRQAQAMLTRVGEDELASLLRALTLLATSLALKLDTPNQVDQSASALREELKRRIDNGERTVERSAQRLNALIDGFRREFLVEVNEIDSHNEAWPEYRKLLLRLLSDDLPRFEARFRDMLRTETIRGVGLFQAQLEQSRQRIKTRIAEINESLHDIDYSVGTHIALIAEPTADVEIREFQRVLRECLADTVSGEELYTEAKFLKVKSLIERFQGRAGLSDEDRRWTEKVSDVRQWFHFAAAERYRETGADKDFYTDSAGKSGGQKEKLAYTVLASGLAYQFGLTGGSEVSGRFRLVVIDEAFGRGSDESTRYALELFQRLGFQLLIVTPLQKIQVIEDYVGTLHFVHNQDGQQSQIRSIGIENYRAERAQRRERSHVAAG
jgi:uncharacterized protein YPO0396